MEKKAGEHQCGELGWRQKGRGCLKGSTGAPVAAGWGTPVPVLHCPPRTCAPWGPWHHSAWAVAVPSVPTAPPAECGAP